MSEGMGGEDEGRVRGRDTLVSQPLISLLKLRQAGREAALKTYDKSVARYPKIARALRPARSRRGW